MPRLLSAWPRAAVLLPGSPSPMVAVLLKCGVVFRGGAGAWCKASVGVDVVWGDRHWWFFFQTAPRERV